MGKHYFLQVESWRHCLSGFGRSLLSLLFLNTPVSPPQNKEFYFLELCFCLLQVNLLCPPPYYCTCLSLINVIACKLTLCLLYFWLTSIQCGCQKSTAQRHKMESMYMSIYICTCAHVVTNIQVHVRLQVNTRYLFKS